MSPFRLKARSKYGAIKEQVDGYVFDSRKEARRYCELKLLLRAGEIKDLEVHPKFPICGKPGDCVALYEADFGYKKRFGVGLGQTWLPQIEDVKSVATRKKEVYRLKKKLVESQHDIKIVEV